MCASLCVCVCVSTVNVTARSGQREVRGVVIPTPCGACKGKGRYVLRHAHKHTVCALGRQRKKER